MHQCWLFSLTDKLKRFGSSNTLMEGIDSFFLIYHFATLHDSSWPPLALPIQNYKSSELQGEKYVQAQAKVSSNSPMTKQAGASPKERCANPINRNILSLDAGDCSASGLAEIAHASQNLGGDIDGCSSSAAEAFRVKQEETSATRASRDVTHTHFLSRPLARPCCT